jgi:hypothetical protein
VHILNDACRKLISLSVAMVAMAACSSHEASDSSSAGSSGAAGQASADGDVKHFSFFVTSLVAMQRLSGSESGFGGDLRFGQSDGLSGADEICRQIAESSLKGAGAKKWRAFLSATAGPGGAPVNAIDRVGDGPWYDRLARLVANTKADLAMTRPLGADATIINDLPNEEGLPNHAPDGMTQIDNHDTLTGSDATGKLYKADASVTCKDWTSAVGTDGKPRVGHSWPRQGLAGLPGFGAGGTSGGGFPMGLPMGFPMGFPMAGRGGGFSTAGFGDMSNWMSALDEAGCAPGVSIVEMGPPNPSNPTVGSGGGYGGIYCFALTP